MEANDWSVPEFKLYHRAANLLDAGTPAALATVVAVEGSAYRRPGARMLIVPGKGESVGAITAGCLEDAIRELAARVTKSGEPTLERYDLSGDDDDLWGLGVGCNGVVDVFVDRLDDRYRPLIDAATGDGPLGVVQPVDGPSAGALYYYDRLPDGAGAFRAADGGEVPDWVTSVRSDVVDLLDGRSRPGTQPMWTGDKRTREVFVDAVNPPPELVVVGTGPDVPPVIEFGSRAGFDVTVVGFRGAKAVPDAFPGATNVVSTSPARIREAVDFSDTTHVVLMTHNFVDDAITLEELIRTDIPYLGLLGPRKRFEELWGELADRGVEFDGERTDRTYTPVGLDLGGGAPQQIALSIVAEVLAVANDRTGGHLRDRAGPIHGGSDWD